MKRLIVAAGLAAALLPAKAYAGMPVLCENCATWWDQIVEVGAAVETKIQAAMTAVNTLNTYKDAAINTIRLPETIKYMATTDYQQLTGLVNRGSMSSGYPSQMLGGLTGTASYVASYPEMLALQTRAVGNSLKSAADLLGIETSQLSSRGETLAALERESSDSEGRNQILQSGNRLNAANADFERQRAASDIAYKQAVLTDISATRERESYISTLTSAQQDAGITSACAAYKQTGVSVQLPACETWTGGGANTITASR